MPHKPVKRSQSTQRSHVCDSTCASTGRRQEGGEPEPERHCSWAHPWPWERREEQRPDRPDGPDGTAGPDAGGLLTFGAHEAPAHVDMGVMPLALPGSEVIRADDTVGRDRSPPAPSTGESQFDRRAVPVCFIPAVFPEP